MDFNIKKIINYFKVLTLEEQLALVKQDGMAIQFMQNPLKKVQMLAVKYNGYAIQYIQNPTLEMQLIALRSMVKREILNYLNLYIKKLHPRVETLININ